MDGGGASKKRMEKTGAYLPAAAAVLLIVLLAAGRDDHYPVRALLWHADAVLWWILILAASLGQGSVVFRWANGAQGAMPPGLKLAAASGLGLGLLSAETLVIGALGLMNTPALTLLVLAAAVVPLFAAKDEAAGVLTGALAEVRERARGTTLPLALSVAAAAAVFPLVLLPTRAFDALSYHLEVPLRYLQAGAVVNIPENLYSYSPLLTQMLYGLGMGLAGPDLAGLIYYTYFLLAIWTLWKGGEEIFGSAGSAWAAALMALTPVFLVEVPQAGADWSVTFYILAALLTTAGGRRGARLMVLAGILAGMAAACRHQGLGYALVLIPAAGIWTDLRARRTGSLRAWFIFTAAALLTASPWYVKNLIQTGDPLYPLFASLAGKMTYGVGFVDSFTGSRPLHLLWSWALVPFQSAFDPLSLSMTATTGVLSLVLVMLLPALKGKRMGSGYPLLWVVLAFFAWHMTFRTFRYIMPVMAVAWLWLGAALAAVLEKNGVRERALRYAVCLALAVNGATFLALTDYVNRSVAPALGVLSPERYLRETYEVYPAIDHLNSLEPSPGRVLFVGEMRGFYSGFPREVPSHNAPNRLFEMIKEGRSSAAVSLELRKRGFTHILFNPSELERMAWGNRNAPLWRLDEGQKTRLHSFFRERTDTLYSANGVSVHRIFDE